MRLSAPKPDRVKHKIRMCTMIMAALTVVSFAGSLNAKTLTVAVDAKSGPWSLKPNPKMKYGIGDQGEPVIVPGLSGDGLGKVEIYAQGTTGTTAKAGIGPVGVESIEANDSKVHGKYYPSFYAPKLLYPAFAHALIVSFVNADGTLVSRPVIVGEGVRLPIPEGATGLALGYNDVSFKGNTGALDVVIVIPDE